MLARIWKLQCYVWFYRILRTFIYIFDQYSHMRTVQNKFWSNLSHIHIWHKLAFVISRLNSAILSVKKTRPNLLKLALVRPIQASYTGSRYIILGRGILYWVEVYYTRSKHLTLKQKPLLLVVYAKIQPIRPECKAYSIQSSFKAIYISQMWIMYKLKITHFSRVKWISRPKINNCNQTNK